MSGAKVEEGCMHMYTKDVEESSLTEDVGCICMYKPCAPRSRVTPGCSGYSGSKVRWSFSQGAEQDPLAEGEVVGTGREGRALPWTLLVLTTNCASGGASRTALPQSRSPCHGLPPPSPVLRRY